MDLLNIISLVFSILTLILGFEEQNKLLLCISIGIVCYHIMNIVLFCFDIRILPLVNNSIVIVLIAILLFAVLVTAPKYKRITCIITLFTVVLILFLFCFGDFYIYKTIDNIEYIGVSSKLTGPVETTVRYYERIGKIFISSKYTFCENYGRVLTGWKQITYSEPYEISYNPDK